MRGGIFMQLKWDDSLNIGIEKIDNQHKELLEKINYFFKAVDDGTSKEEAMRTLEFLESYTNEHFKDEEDLQIKYEYSKYNQQCQQHRAFINQLDEIRYVIGRYGVSGAVVNQMQKKIVDYWEYHINYLDRDLGEYLKEKIK